MIPGVLRDQFGRKPDSVLCLVITPQSFQPIVVYWRDPDFYGSAPGTPTVSGAVSRGEQLAQDFNFPLEECLTYKLMYVLIFKRDNKCQVNFKVN